MTVPTDRRVAGRIRLTAIAAALALAVAAGSTPSTVSGQLRAGPQLSFASEVFGGTVGVGPRVELGIPAIPVRLAASGDYFFPTNCRGCRYWEGNVNLLISLPIMPIPFLRYVGGGWHMQSVRSGTVASTMTARGFNAVGGVGSDDTVVEFRYEFVKDIPDQYVLSVAILLL